jgi:hypothetical protein
MIDAIFLMQQERQFSPSLRIGLLMLSRARSLRYFRARSKA